MLGVDAPSVIIFIKSLKAAMSKSFYYALIVNRQLSLVKLFFALLTSCPVIEVFYRAQTSASPGGYCQNMDNLQHCTVSPVVSSSFFGSPAIVLLQAARRRFACVAVAPLHGEARPHRSLLASQFFNRAPVKSRPASCATGAIRKSTKN